MAYEKYEWKSGQVITAEKLNHMEDGINENASGGSGSGVICIKGIVTSIHEGGEYEGDEPVMYAKLDSETTEGSRYKEIETLRKDGAVVLIVIRTYVKDGELDPTGTGTLGNVVVFYPATSLNEWKTLSGDAELAGGPSIWAITMQAID